MTDDPAVLIPAGAPILDAAGWVGRACWAELALHEVLTGWLAVEADPAAVADLWSARSGAAARAEAWSQRLPELREFPRPGFVVPPSGAVEALFADLAGRVDPPDTAGRRDALVAVLDALVAGYEAHRAVAVGPADAPTARTLREVLDGLAARPAGDVDPDVAARIAGLGGLP